MTGVQTCALPISSLKILELDFVEAWVRTRMNNKACGFGSNGNFEGRHNADEEVVRVVA